MYLSHLLIDVGDNPDRPRPGRLWLRDVYHVHQRLSMAFPTREQCVGDPHFLHPFDSAGFEPRFERSRFLFRIDNGVEDESPRALILMQSALRPDWDYAFHNARVFLAAEPETRQYDPAFAAGHELRFRIRVNLNKKSCQHGKRLALTWDKGQRPDDVIGGWFERKTAGKGFDVRRLQLVHLGWVGGYKASTERMKFRSALLEGRLTVTHPPAFAQAIASGIGSAKAFGFGLLSVAPVS
jgi:CRISPR system Cascade subunit CasE